MSDVGARSTASILAELNGRLRGPSLMVWLCAASVWIFILWAAFAWIDEIVRAPGEFISTSRPQIIQNLEGGILAELLVQEGDVVARGDVLARLHDTRFNSEVADLQDQIAGLEVRQLRLEAELAGQFDFTVPDGLAGQAGEMVASERALLKARQEDFVKRSEGAKRVMQQSAEEKRLLEGLLEKKIVALIEVTRARKAHADSEKRYDEIITQAELERAEAYSETLKELATLRQNLRASQDQLNRTVLLSPLRGVVNNLSVTTIGGVVRPGEEILEIIPLDEEMFVEARVEPRNIANIRRGQEATIKLTAYDYTIYGTLKGRVDFISADTFKDERAREADGDPHYKVSLRVDMSALTPRQAGIEIRPGMQAEVELHTGEKTVLQYLLKPLYKSQQALREP
ncbi:Type I secretion membrane fusion protein, HlyD [Roseovarius sp. EC-HK134]|jgi:adhesin transport system membrane fusion protein|uniref:Membrane fusion protein (MFP) family protein n=1 Tax=Roseovarius mucosus TaxID=215743 RepID=A0A1V0RKY7_9RHOB|nr:MULTISPECIES: HlyD family type I secretion periplasmic adaptor subunit [Roseovarius]ARE82417.1 type I secretion system membrane fusion protein PrsE [Roseovarius mucosus]AWZ22494.1 HlyD family secretion protein [Roseovarius sp. AK1035]EDM32224.1 Type I secretion membrane fusion protein, HlyD [Roseovarius sp. TM1035]MBW4972740.1 HlyD family type I secretion periplasmic adaptor subunit [Roseovarius mucosus]VVT25301.1 Type I secretion membrane fusion protein, HlyD [Roseovarius sp. EC-SD190]